LPRIIERKIEVNEYLCYYILVEFCIFCRKFLVIKFLESRPHHLFYKYPTIFSHQDPFSPTIYHYNQLELQTSITQVFDAYKDIVFLEEDINPYTNNYFNITFFVVAVCLNEHLTKNTDTYLNYIKRVLSEILNHSKIIGNIFLSFFTERQEQIINFLGLTRVDLAAQLAAALGFPAAGIGYHTPALGFPAAGIGYHTPAPTAGIGYHTPAPTAGIGYPAPTYALGHAAPTAGIGYSAPTAGIGYPAPTYALGYAAPTAGIGYPAPTAGIGYPAPTYALGLMKNQPFISPNAWHIYRQTYKGGGCSRRSKLRKTRKSVKKIKTLKKNI
jgi:hypothetical protein